MPVIGMYGRSIKLVGPSVSIDDNNYLWLYDEFVYDLSIVGHLELKPKSYSHYPDIMPGWREVQFFDINGIELTIGGKFPFCPPNVIEFLKEQLGDQCHW